MSVKLRLRRLGRKKIPVFSIVAADSRNARDGRYIEDIGRYYPLREPAEVRLDEERALYWLDNGAQPSDTVRSILYRRGLMLQNHLIQKGTSPDEIEEKVSEFRERMAQKGEDIKMAVRPRGEDALERERERAEDLDEEAKLRAQATPLSVVQEEEEADAADAEAEAPADDTADEDAAAKSAAEEPEADADDAEADTDTEADADTEADTDAEADADASDDESAEDDEKTDE
ncbi:MAG: 30S ribosomal protein S16 [Salinivenus sp.]